MSCEQQPEEGVWLDANSNNITRAEIRYNCQDQVLNGEPWPPGPPWFVHLWGACSPTDCDWGEIGGRRLDSGVIYARYNHGFAVVHVYLQNVAPGELWLATITHYTDNSGREDREEEQFLHAQPNALRAAAKPAELTAFRAKMPGTDCGCRMHVETNPTGSNVKVVKPHARRPLPVARASK